MKKLIWKYISLTTILVILISASCIQIATEQVNIVVLETLTPTETTTITLTLENTFRTPIPTLSLAVEQKMVRVLESTECNLPCYAGIIPGKTNFDEAKLILDSLGANFWAQGEQGNTKWYDYIIRIDDPSIRMSNGAIENHSISNSIGLLVTDGVVEQIRVWILGQGLSPKFQNYWSRYTPRGVFIQIGVPDEIYSGGGVLALVYKDLGIINIYETFLKDGQLCPQNETTYFDRRFEITNPNSPVEIYSDHENALKRKEIWQPIEESLGVSVQEFYNQVIADDSVCFDILIK